MNLRNAMGWLLTVLIFSGLFVAGVIVAGFRDTAILFGALVLVGGLMLLAADLIDS